MLKRILFLVAASNLLACSSEPQSKPWQLAPDAPTTNETQDEEQERVRVMQLVKVFEPTGTDGAGDYHDWDASKVTQIVEDMCSWRHECVWPNFLDMTCAEAHVLARCDVARDTCTAQTLQELASSSSAGVPIRATAGSGSNYRHFNYVFPPQSEASRLSLLLEARRIAEKVAFKSLILLSDKTYQDMYTYDDPFSHVTGCKFADSALSNEIPAANGSGYLLSPRFRTDPDDNGPQALDQRTNAAVVIEGLTNGERIMREASIEAAGKMLNVAEWDRGSTNSFILGQQRAFSRPGLSRATAAHLLVGGSDGLRLATAADTTTNVPTIDSFCTAQMLSPSGKRALKAFRDVGIDPAHILDATTTSDLVDGGSLDTGSVKQRLALQLGRSVTSALSELGLTIGDFTDARQFLADELRAFNRSKSAFTRKLGSLKVYAATATEPPNRPAGYYTAIARAEPSVGQYFDLSTSTDLESGPLNWKRKVWDLETFEGTVQNQLNAIPWLATATGSLAAEVRPLLLAAGTMRNSTSATVRLQRVAGASNKITVNAPAGYKLPNGSVGLRWLVGEDQLACALNGNIEGGTCSITLAGAAVPAIGDAGLGKNYSITITDAQATTLGMTTNRSYIVGKNANGDHVLLASLPALNRPWTKVYNMQFAVMPDVERRAADVLRPSPDWCAHAAVECNGNTFDERLPLENELNDDGNGVESSWKYYLGRAKDASAAADQLGEAYVNAQLSAQNYDVQVEVQEAQARERVQGYLETLQESCGISMDSDSLLKMFGAQGMLEDLSAGSCTNTCGNIPDPNHIRQCVAGSCIIVPTLLISNQDTATASSRLARCLGASEQIPLTTYGNKPVCVHNTTTLQNSCLNDPTCPRVVPVGKDPTTYCTQDIGQSPWSDGSTGWKAITSTLGFWDTTDGAYQLPTLGSGEPKGLGRCRYKEKYDNGWFTLDRYSRWMGNDPGQDLKECTDKGFLTQAQRDAGFGYDPAKYGFNPAITEMSNINSLYPLWLHIGVAGSISGVSEMGPTNSSDGEGWGLYMRRCPTKEEIVDADGNMNPALANLDIKARMWLLEKSFKCQATDLKNALGKRLLADLPRSVLDGLLELGPLGVFPEFGGEYGQLIADLRGALVLQSDNIRLIDDEIAGFSTDLQEYRIAVQGNVIKKDLTNLEAHQIEQEKIINDARLEQAEIKQDGALTVGVFAWVSQANAGNMGIGLLNVSPIADAVHGEDILDQERRIHDAQQNILNLKLEGTELQQRQNELDLLNTNLQHRKSMNRHWSTIQGYVTQIKAGRELADTKLMALENLRFKAKRALDGAVAAASPQLLASEKKLAKVAGTVAELERARYEDAYSSATRLAFLAKRAIEVRLGVHFSEMTEHLPLLDAPPSTWENDICTASGIDYERLQNAAGGKLPNGSLNGFIGTYVRKLENVVDAYQLQYAFRQGTDTLTVSLKDDVFRAAASCSTPSKNLLKESSTVLNGSALALTGITGPSTALRGLDSSAWFPKGCAAGTSCVFIGDQQLPVAKDTDLANANLVNVYANLANASLQQKVKLEAGRYVLSWYGLSTDTQSTFKLADALGVALAPTKSDKFTSHTTADGSWVRNYQVYEVPVAGDYNVSVTPSIVAGSYVYTRFGAPMLEAVAADVATPAPSLFAVTGASRDIAGPCRDIDGKTFRDGYWTRQCENTCGALGVANCAADSQVQRCYWESTFALTENEIMAGRVLQSSGFAGGNFNYRLDSVAVNVVGSGLRDCSGIGGSSCYGVGFVPYSLLHHGPFTVKDHAGNLVEVPLFNGRIEQAKGLGAERYLTNPLSSTDRGLIEPYLRTELQGRPFDGNYVVRIWDDPGFRFDAVEDVQLMVNYRYWTPAK